MQNPKSAPPKDIDSMIEAVETVLTEMNTGFLIYQLEDATDPQSLKLVYANRESCEYTESDLHQRVGKTICEAFPPLAETEIPQVYAEVVQTKQARMIGLVEYTDQTIKQGSYSVKAFPMPHDCVGVLFEDVDVRRQVDALLKKESEALGKQITSFQSTLASLGDEVTGALTAIKAEIEDLQDRVSGAERKKLETILERAEDLGKRVVRIKP